MSTLSTRDSQSSAFFNTPGTDQLYSGVTINTPSAAAICRLNAATTSGGFSSSS
ncbi:hypothetical protein HNR34_003334 [Geobacillus subterraneus]